MTFAETPYSALPDPDTSPGFYADVPIKRLMAFLIDSVIILVLSIGVALLTMGIGFFLFFAIYAFVGLIYRISTLASRSATWGMRLMAIEFRTHTGARFDLGGAVIHTLGLIVSFSMVPLQVISAVMMLTTARGQGLTDMVLGTVCLNRAARR